MRTHDKPVSLPLLLSTLAAAAPSGTYQHAIPHLIVTDVNSLRLE
jgi:hypothetical protein